MNRTQTYKHVIMFDIDEWFGVGVGVAGGVWWGWGVLDSPQTYIQMESVNFVVRGTGEYNYLM